tara:strand:+ start:1760 stop:2872 length:1113 start_codon:yes stop_codon:yes gene_type:complete
MSHLEDNNPFNEVLVKPQHGTSSVTITWSLDVSAIDPSCSDFLVRRSPDGYTNIKILHKPVKIVKQQDNYSFLDEDAYKGTRGRTWHYQVILREAGVAFYSGWVAARGRDPLLFAKEEEAKDPVFIKEYKSNDVDVVEEECLLPDLDPTAYSEDVRTRNQQDGFLKRQELGAARAIMRLERKRMAIIGTKFLVFKRLIEGKDCNVCRDKETNQVLNTNCETCYDTGTEKGYDSPVCVYAQNITPKREELNPRQTGEGEDDKIMYVFRYVSAPEISQFDLLVQTHDDMRFVVEKVEKFLFKGKQPLISHITASLIHRDHVLYTLPADCSLPPVSIDYNNIDLDNLKLPPVQDVSFDLKKDIESLTLNSNDV